MVALTPIPEAHPLPPAKVTAETPHIYSTSTMLKQAMLHEKMATLVSRLRSSASSESDRDYEFVLALNKAYAGELVYEFPIIQDGNDQGSAFQVALDETKILPMPLMRFSRLSFMLNDHLPGTPNVVRIIEEYLPELASYSDLRLPGPCQKECTDRYANVKPARAIVTVQDLTEKTLHARGYYKTGEIPKVAVATRRYVIAFVPERYNKPNWAPLILNKTMHDKMFTCFAQKGSCALVGGSTRVTGTVAHDVTWYDAAGKRRWWTYTKMQQAEGDASTLKGNVDKQTVVIACARFIPGSCKTLPGKTLRNPHPAMTVGDVSAAMQRLTLEEPQDAPSSVATTGIETRAYTVARGVLLNNKRAQRRRQRKSYKPLRQVVPPQAPTPAVSQIPYTRVLGGPQVSQPKTRADSTLLLDEKTAELISVQLIQVQCPATSEQLQNYLQELLGRIHLVQEAMLGEL